MVRVTAPAGSTPADWTCTWEVYLPLVAFCPSDCDCEGFHAEQWVEARGEITGPCGAPVLIWPDQAGWTCEAGHEHATYGGPAHTEYFDDDEIEAARQAGRPLRGRRIDGRPL